MSHSWRNISAGRSRRADVIGLPPRMTRLSFTLGAVDVTFAVREEGVGDAPHAAPVREPNLPRLAPVEAAVDAPVEVTVWWSCAECVVEVELPAVDGFVLTCPDCPGTLHEMWRWEPVSA